MLFVITKHSVQRIVIVSEIVDVYPRQKIFHQYVVNLMVDAFVRHVQKRSVEKIRLFKSIEQAIRIFPDNAVINLNALRVGELGGNIDGIFFRFSFK